jgi:hypothetical protein
VRIDDEVERMNRLLMPLLGNQRLVNLWWDTPNHSFDMKTPADVWDYDQKQVFEYIRRQYSGDYL